MIETDGVSACIHFRHPKPPKSEKDEVVSKKKAKTHTKNDDKKEKSTEKENAK